MLLGLLAAWFGLRRIYYAGRVAGYLEGRNFLARRRQLVSTGVFVDGQPLEDCCCVWLETNGFTADERERIAVGEHIERVEKLPIDGRFEC